MPSTLSPAHRYDLVAYVAIQRLSTLQSLMGLRRTLRRKRQRRRVYRPKRFAVEDDESSVDESDVKLREGELSERDELALEAGRGGLLSAGRGGLFWSSLVGIASDP
jgi:hypothetical protein